jgi:hypothetical protein
MAQRQTMPSLTVHRLCGRVVSRAEGCSTCTCTYIRNERGRSHSRRPALAACAGCVTRPNRSCTAKRSMLMLLKFCPWGRHAQPSAPAVAAPWLHWHTYGSSSRCVGKGGASGEEGVSGFGGLVSGGGGSTGGGTVGGDEGGRPGGGGPSSNASRTATQSGTGRHPLAPSSQSKWQRWFRLTERLHTGTRLEPPAKNIRAPYRRRVCH